MSFILRGRSSIWRSWSVTLQHFVTFWEIAEARNVVFSKQNHLQGLTSNVGEAAGAR